jgi:hypothetical protein
VRRENHKAAERVKLNHADKLKTTMKKSKDQACPRIYTRCPACHNDTLTITKTGRLLCTWHVCPNPILIDRIGEPSYVWPGERAGDRKPVMPEPQGVKALVSAQCSASPEEWWTKFASLLAQKMEAGCVQSVRIEKKPNGKFEFEVTPTGWPNESS